MAFGYNRVSGSNTIQIVGDLVAGADPQRNTKIDFENDQINFVAGGITVLSITPTLISSSTDISSYGYLKSLNSSGDEGGEILLARSVTNNTLTGSGITIDSYQNRIRFFEQGGSARGAFIDLTECDPGAGTNLLVGGAAGSGDITSVTAGSGLTGGGTSGAVTLSLSSSISVTEISASTYTGLPVNPSVDFFAGQFGDGSDGDLTVVGTYTAAKELYFNNLTIPSGTIFKPNGHRVFVANTLTVESNASFNDDGTDGAAQAGGAALASRNYLVAASGKGGNGVSLTTSNFSNGTVGNSTTNTSANNLGQTVNGGKGGNVTLRGNVGGNGGTASTASGGQKWNGVWQLARWTSGGFNTGAGGGGGAINVVTYTSGIFSSGGGGAGGGAVWISAKNIVNNGRISANGGKGANGILGTGTAECSGGGGGGGGNLTIITKTLSGSLGTVQANGGIGGTGAWNTGTGVGMNGTDGNSGSVCIVVLS